MGTCPRSALSSAGDPRLCRWTRGGSGWRNGHTLAPQAGGMSVAMFRVDDSLEDDFASWALERAKLLDKAKLLSAPAMRATPLASRHCWRQEL